MLYTYILFWNNCLKLILFFSPFLISYSIFLSVCLLICSTITLQIFVVVVIKFTFSLSVSPTSHSTHFTSPFEVTCQEKREKVTETHLLKYINIQNICRRMWQKEQQNTQEHTHKTYKSQQQKCSILSFNSSARRQQIEYFDYTFQLKRANKNGFTEFRMGGIMN